MLIIRLIFILLVITGLVLLGCYLYTNDRKYLQYLKKTFLFSLYFVATVAVLFFARRLLYV